MADSDKRELQFKLYRLLLQKYGELINEREKRTIGEIKGLVSGDDLTIQGIIGDFKPENYSFERDYASAAQNAFDFVSAEINYVDSELNLNYWLSPKELFSAGVADDEDLSVFLCSLLLALGDEKASIIVCELTTLKTHAVVVTELDGQFLLLDPCQKHQFRDFLGKREEVIQKYSFGGGKIKRFLYKFNHSNYEQFV